MKKYYGRKQEINQIINMLSENKFNSLAITGPRQSKCITNGNL